MRCSAVVNCFWILWSELEEKRRLYCKNQRIERQNDVWTKNANNIFVSKIWECWTDVHLHIVSWNQEVNSYQLQRKITRELDLTLKKSSFLLKVLKTYVFTQIAECSVVTHLHYPELKSSAYIQP